MMCSEWHAFYQGLAVKLSLYIAHLWCTYGERYECVCVSMFCTACTMSANMSNCMVHRNYMYKCMDRLDRVQNRSENSKQKLDEWQMKESAYIKCHSKVLDYTVSFQVSVSAPSWHWFSKSLELYGRCEHHSSKRNSLIWYFIGHKLRMIYRIFILIKPFVYFFSL